MPSCGVCLCVRVSVRHVRESCQTNKDIFEIFSPSGSHTILVFPCQTAYIVPVLMYGCETWPPQSTCSLASMHLTHGHYTQDLEDTVYSPCVKCGSRRTTGCSPLSHLVTELSVCGSSTILLAVHLARTNTEPLQRVSDKYRLIGSDQQEDLTTLGSVQLRQILAL